MFFASALWNSTGYMRQEFDGIFFFFLNNTPSLPLAPAVLLFRIKMFCFIMLPYP